jgi:hypothetical protein
MKDLPLNHFLRGSELKWNVKSLSNHGRKKEKKFNYDRLLSHSQDEIIAGDIVCKWNFKYQQFFFYY